MYNPATIVDLRRNPSFTVASSPGSDAPTHTPGKHISREHKHSHALFPNESPMEGGHQKMTNDLPKISVGVSSQLSTCSGCYALIDRIENLSASFHSLQERQASFESEILTIMKSISHDIQGLKDRDTRQQGRMDQSFAPRVGLFDTSHRFKSPLNSTEMEQTRDAIAGACLELERLVAEARNRTSSTRMHS
jgi:hypothetical protein